MSKTNNIFIVYNQQRWDLVRLIKGFTNKEDAEKLRKSLKEKETRYDEIYYVDEVEMDKKDKEELKTCEEECIRDLGLVIERLEMEFPLIYKQRSEPVAIGLSNREEKDFMKIMIIPELKRIITNLKDFIKNLESE